MIRRRCAVALLALLATACDGPGVVDPSRPVVSIPSATGGRAQLVGSWQRTLYFVDDFNFARASETTFQFSGDGTVVRAQASHNLSLGLVDITTSIGRWQLDGTRLTIDYITPGPAQVVLDARIVGTTLELAGQSFRRLS